MTIYIDKKELKELIGMIFDFRRSPSKTYEPLLIGYLFEYICISCMRLICWLINPLVLFILLLSTIKVKRY